MCCLDVADLVSMVDTLLRSRKDCNKKLSCRGVRRQDIVRYSLLSLGLRVRKKLHGIAENGI